jgi:hypothetical protein
VRFFGPCVRGVRSGGSGTITILGARDCAWTLSSNAAWITTEGETRGQGPATVTYHVAPNTTPLARRATISIASAQLEIAQEGAPCQFSIDNHQIEIAAAGGTATVRTTAMSGCAWTAHTQDGWIAITAGTDRNGTGDVNLTVSRNTGIARQGTVVVAGQAVAVRQQGAAPSSAPTPTPPPPPPAPPPSPAPTPIGRIELEGRLTNLQGSCPAVTFILETYTVYADQSTDYRRGGCSHLRNRSSVEVRGQRYSDGRVRAERITIEDRDDD